MTRDFWNCLIAADTKPFLKKRWEYRYCVVQGYANPEEDKFYRTDKCMGNFKTREEAINWTKAFPIKDRHLSFTVYKYKVTTIPVYEICMGSEHDKENGTWKRKEN